MPEFTYRVRMVPNLDAPPLSEEDRSAVEFAVRDYLTSVALIHGPSGDVLPRSWQIDTYDRGVVLTAAVEAKSVDYGATAVEYTVLALFREYAVFAFWAMSTVDPLPSRDN